VISYCSTLEEHCMASWTSASDELTIGGWLMIPTRLVHISKTQLSDKMSCSTMFMIVRNANAVRNASCHCSLHRCDESKGMKGASKQWRRIAQQSFVKQRYTSTISSYLLYSGYHLYCCSKERLPNTIIACSMHSNCRSVALHHRLRHAGHWVICHLFHWGYCFVSRQNEDANAFCYSHPPHWHGNTRIVL
jgi:hypothetical protein